MRNWTPANVDEDGYSPCSSASRYDTSYAVTYRLPSSPSAERYIFFLSLFVFALVERENEQQKWICTMLRQANTSLKWATA
jgi:hypothetical protein